MALDLQQIRREFVIQRRDVFYGVIALAASLVVIMAGLIPSFNQMQAVRNSQRRVQGELTKAQQRAAILSQAAVNDQENFQLVDRALPLGKQPLVVLRALEKVAGETGVSIGKYDVSPGLISTDSAQANTPSRRSASQKKSLAQSMSVSLEASGRLDQLTSFIETLEGSLPLMRVSEMSLSPSKRGSSESSETLSYTALLQLQAFYAPLQKSDFSKATVQALTPSQRAALDRLQTMTSILDVRPLEPLQDFQNEGLFEVSQPVPPDISPSDVEASPAPEEDQQ